MMWWFRFTAVLLGTLAFFAAVLAFPKLMVMAIAIVAGLICIIKFAMCVADSSEAGPFE